MLYRKRDKLRPGEAQRSNSHTFLFSYSQIIPSFGILSALFFFFFSVPQIEEGVMNTREEIIEAISIGLVVCTFLFNTGRALRGIELCKESLVLLNNQVLSKKEQSSELIYQGFYETMFKAYCLIHDNKNAITYGRKLLVIYCERDETVQEGLLSIELAERYKSQKNYVEAKDLYERAINIARKTGDREKEAIACGNLGTVSLYLGKHIKAKEYLEKALATGMEIGDRAGEATNYGNLGIVFTSLGHYDKAKEYLEKTLAINMEIGDRAGEASSYVNLGIVFKSVGDYAKAKEYHEKALAIFMEIGDRAGEASSYGNLGIGFTSLGDYAKAKEYLEKTLAISIEIGDRAGEASSYENLGIVFRSVGDYVKAKEYQEKALVIYMEIGDIAGEASSYGNLGILFNSVGDFVKAKEYHERALAINMESGYREGAARNYGNMGFVLSSVGDYVKAKEYHEKALAINMEIGDKAGEASSYGNLGIVFTSLGDYVKAKEYHEKALAIQIEIGDRAGEARNYGNLGGIFQFLGEKVKAKGISEKALAIDVEIGNRAGEATCYGNLGNVYKSFGDYVKAKECLEKALAINTEIGDRLGEALTYRNLGGVFESLGEYVRAMECYKKALAIEVEIGYRAGEASSYRNLGNVLCKLRQFRESNEYFENALTIMVAIGDRRGEAEVYQGLGDVLRSLGDNISAKQYLEKALVINLEIGDRAGEAASYAKLGTTCVSLAEYVIAEEYFEKALLITKDTGDVENEYNCYFILSMTKLLQEKYHEAFSCLFQSIEKYEDLRGFKAVNDQIKISIADRNIFSCKRLSGMLCDIGNPNSALYVEELGRARSLADLMETRYPAEKHISANPQSWIGIENVITKDSNCSCLYISYHAQRVLLWVLTTGEDTSFREKKVRENFLYKTLAKPTESLDEFFAFIVESFRSFGILPDDVCEDRSLVDIEPAQFDSSREETLAALRRGKDEKDPEPSLTLLHEILIKPVSDLLEEPEIIIVPDRNLYRVPFAALLDESGKYLSETFRIRLVPSLTTMKLIQDSPVDYHCQTGALIVGDPDVGDVIYNGRLKNFLPLPGARKEAEMVGRLLGVQPLLGEDATKQRVLQKVASVSLIHIAAHGNAERGEIAFAPPSSTTGIPQEGDFLLKMSEISKVQLRAKLVVLSCCHSGRGQIRAKGVVGIAHAFLGSGARSVLVALWALGDIATEKLMNCFYKHLVRGESASESLHEAMKWMRENGFTKVSEWAPFMLIGDNVSFDVGTLKVSENKEENIL